MFAFAFRGRKRRGRRWVRKPASRQQHPKQPEQARNECPGRTPAIRILTERMRCVRPASAARDANMYLHMEPRVVLGGSLGSVDSCGFGCGREATSHRIRPTGLAEAERMRRRERPQ